MVYDLGIDVGTSYTAAAIRRSDGTVEVVGLGPIADNIPSVVYLNDDGSLIVGDAAARRAAIDPAGAAREFKRRLGDPTPLILRTSPFSAEALIAKMIDHVLARVTDRERDRPRHTVVTHPANWGPYKLELFDQAFRIANVEDHSRLAEPQAAAMAYASEARVANGSVVAIYDLGGGTFDAAVLRKTDIGFEPLGESVGIEHLGGVDFDEAVMQHVRVAVGDRWPTDPNDPSLPAPMLHLRRACMEAKELLSSEQDVQIPVLLPGVDTTVSLDRPRFETMITPRLDDSMTALDAAIMSAGIRPEDLTAVLLVGGSSRIPLVGRMLRERFGDRVKGDVDPLYAVARGAALAAGVAAGEAIGEPSYFHGSGSAETGVAPVAAAAPTLIAPRNPAEPPPAQPLTPAEPASVMPAPSPAAPVAPAASATPPSAPQPPAATPPDMPPPSGPPPTMMGAPTSGPAGPPAANNPGPALPPPQPGTRPQDRFSTPPAPQPAVRPMPLNGTEPNKSGRAKVLVPLVAVALVAAAAGAFALSRGGDGSEEAGGTTTESTSEGTGGTGDTPKLISTTASPQDMVEVPAGTYPLGAEKPEPNAAETKSTTKDLPAFFIDAFEVSNEQYFAFVTAKGAAAPASWVGQRYPGDEQALRPVQGVTFQWATAYCQSLGKRLPSEAEWEAAARGTDGRVFPWGADAAAGGLPDSGTYDRGSIVANKTPEGVFDLTGNAWEWVGDTYDTRVKADLHILRGGQNGYLRKSSLRLPVSNQSSALKIAGFRCAADAVDPAIAPLSFGDFDAPATGNEVEEVPLAAGVLFDDTFDDATSGWLEVSTDKNRFGYHPNGFFHLETKTEDVDVMAESPFALQPDQHVAVAASAFVDPANTIPGGIYSYGILFRSSVNKDGRALIFVVDPISQAWLVCDRDTETGKWNLIEKKQRNIPEPVDLEVRMKGDDYEFLIGGAQVYSSKIVDASGSGYTGTGVGMVLISYPESQKAHIHFDEFKIRELG